MTHRGSADRTLRVKELARVEGEGRLRVRVRGGRVTEAQLQIYEPPRFFEGLLVGRSYTEAPDITARICGICPVAYQVTACQAMEAACGVAVDPAIADLRRLLYWGEWIESHALHVYLLHAPDFLGFAGAVELAEHDRPTVERGLAIKRAGNRILEVIGGRAIHPVNVCLGGFHRAPSYADVHALADELRRARDAAVETVAWVAGFDFPDFTHEPELVALRPPAGYPVDGGRLVATTGLDVDPSGFDEAIRTEQVVHSTALHARLAGSDRPYLVGPVARHALNADRLAPLAAEAAGQAGLTGPCRNPFRSIVVRAVELVHACDEAVRAIDAYEPPARASVPVPARRGTGHACTEAPRGVLYHRYDIDDDGTIVAARIVPPTAQNQRAVEDDLRRFVDERVDWDREHLTWHCEEAVRNYDPCISCATHFLELDVEP